MKLKRRYNDLDPLNIVKYLFHLPYWQEGMTCSWMATSFRLFAQRMTKGQTQHSSFRKNHAEHRVDILNPPFLVTAHRAIIVNAGPLYAVRIRFQALRGAEFSAPISQNNRKYRNEYISSAQGFLQQFKHTPDSTGGAAVHEIGQK